MAIDGSRTLRGDSATDDAASAWGGETKDDAEGGTSGWTGGRFEASGVRLDGLLDDLLRLREENGGGLTVAAAHPGLVAIVDRLSSLGMEERMRRRFYDQLGSLKDFACMYGDCRVPADHPTLGKWVRLQRSHYALCRRRMPSPLTCERFAELREVPGFDELSEAPREGGARDDCDAAGAERGVEEGARAAASADSPSNPRSVCATNPGEETKDDDAAGGAKLWAGALATAECRAASSPPRPLPRPRCPSDASDLDSSVASGARRWLPSDSSDLDSSVAGGPDSSVEDRRDDALDDGRPRLTRARGKRRHRRAGKRTKSAPDVPTPEPRASLARQRAGRRLSGLATIPSGRKLLDDAEAEAEAAGAPDRGARPRAATCAGGGRSETAAARAASSPDAAPSPRERPDKEAVAAAMRRKRAKGTSHRRAVQNSRRLKDSFSRGSVRPAPEGRPGDDAPPAADAFEEALSGGAAAVAPRRRREGRAGDDAPPAADAFEEALSGGPAAAAVAVAPRRRRRDNYLSASAPVNPTGGVDEYDKRLEKMKRKQSAEGAAATKGEGEDKCHRRTKDVHLGASLPVNSTGGGDVDPEVGRYETMLEKLTHKLSAEGKDKSQGQTKDRRLAASLPVASGDAVKDPPNDRGPRRDGARSNAVESWDDLQDEIAAALRQSVMDDGAPRDPGGPDGASAASSAAASDDDAGDRGRSAPGTDGSGNGPGRRRPGRRRPGRSANASARGGSVDDRLRRKPRGERLEDASADRLAVSDPCDRRLGRSMPAHASTGGSTFDDRLRRKLQREGRGDRLGQSMPANASTGGNTFDDRLRRKLQGEGPDDRRLGQSMPANASTERSTFDERLRRKLQGEGPDDRRLGQSMPANASTERSTFDERLRRKLQGEGPGDRRLGRSMPANASTERSTFDDRLRRKLQGEGPSNRRLGQSVPANASTERSTFDDRLRRKLQGEGLEGIYGDTAGDDGLSAKSSEAASDNESLGSWDSLDGFRGKRNSRNRCSFGVSWMEKLNRPGWDSKDDSGVGRRGSLPSSSAGRRASSRLSASSVGRGCGVSYANLDDGLPPGKRYSHWKLLFDRNDYDHRKAQSGCVGDVLDAIICSERWHFVAKKNGNVALEMTTRTPAEHKKVELHVRKLEDMYSRSDFYFY